MSRWEYLTKTIGGKKVQEELNDLGDEGWELVSTSALIVSGNTPGTMTVVMKREKVTAKV